MVLLNFRAGGWRLHCKSFFVSYPLLLALASSSTTPFQKLFYCLMKRGKFCWHWQLRKILHFFLLLLLLFCLAKSRYILQTKDSSSKRMQGRFQILTLMKACIYKQKLDAIKFLLSLLSIFSLLIKHYRVCEGCLDKKIPYHTKFKK